MLAYIYKRPTPHTSFSSLLFKSKDAVKIPVPMPLPLIVYRSIFPQALGTLTKTSDPLLQLNLIISLRNLSCNLIAKESIVRLPQVATFLLSVSCL